jgi:hypothetical protein
MSIPKGGWAHRKGAHPSKALFEAFSEQTSRVGQGDVGTWRNQIVSRLDKNRFMSAARQKAWNDMQRSTVSAGAYFK